MNNKKIDEKFDNWLQQYIKESGHQWGFGFYVETIDGKIFHRGTDEYTEWYNKKLEEYKTICAAK